MTRTVFFGIAGSFSHIASQKYFGGKVNLIPSKSIKEVFAHIADGLADYGVVPVENSTTGSILETYDMLMENNMHIIGEVRLKIHHALLVSGKKVKIADIKKCYSHPQAISQCETFFSKNPGIYPVFAQDTASAARFLSENRNKENAAIASLQTAKLYGLSVMAQSIEDNKNNFTRFVVIGRRQNRTGTKASVVFAVKHVPGSLFKALRPYAKWGLNLTKIESRPILGKTWEYIFFADFELKNNFSDFIKMLSEMKEETDFLTLLGLYDRGKTYET